MLDKYICVICPRMGMGDLVSFLGHFKTIFEQTSKKIILITKKSTSGKQLFSDENFCHEIIYLPERKRGIFNILFDITDFFRLVKLIKESQCREVIVLHSSKRYILASKFAGIYKLSGPGYGLQKFFLSKDNRIYNSFFDKALHPRDESENLIKKIFSISKIKDNYFENALIQNNKNIALIGIACSGDEKQWGLSNYINLIKELISLNFDDFCLLAGQRQFEIESAIVSAIKKDCNANIRTTSSLSIKDIYNICCEAKFYVGNDTGFSHIAVSLKKPALIIHGDCPPYKYSSYINAVIPTNNIFNNTSIQKISYVQISQELKKFVKKYQL